MVKIRLKRMGRKNSPFYRIVVSEDSSKRNGKFIEELGYYYPTKSKDDNNLKEYELDIAKYEAWIQKGAKPSDSVKIIANKLKQN